jgi:hypothetical protein
MNSDTTAKINGGGWSFVKGKNNLSNIEVQTFRQELPACSVYAPLSAISFKYLSRLAERAVLPLLVLIIQGGETR